MSRWTVCSCAYIALGICGLVTQAAAAPILLFNETFNGYTQFPAAVPAGDPVNLGTPETFEGASQFWYAARFQTGDGTIDSDLAVQRWGSSKNETPAGRFEDGVGLVFRVNTAGYDQVVLDFDWRTFAVQPADRFIVGYHVGDDLGFDTGANRFRTLNWSSWTELLRNAPFDSFRHQSYALPANSGPVYVAFWIAGGEGHYGKIDNITVTAASTIVIPEPFTGAICLLALGLMGNRHRRQRISL